MAYWTVIGAGLEGDLEGKTFGLTLDTDEKEWTANGASVDKFFASKSGKYKEVSIPENGTQLVNASGQEAAFLKNLNGTTPVKGKGSGRATEKGVNFSWVLDSK